MFLLCWQQNVGYDCLSPLVHLLPLNSFIVAPDSYAPIKKIVFLFKWVVCSRLLVHIIRDNWKPSVLLSLKITWVAWMNYLFKLYFYHHNLLVLWYTDWEGCRDAGIFCPHRRVLASDEAQCAGVYRARACVCVGSSDQEFSQESSTTTVGRPG